MKLKIEQSMLMLEDCSLCFRPIQGTGPIVDVATAKTVMQDVVNRYNSFDEMVEAIKEAAEFCEGEYGNPHLENKLNAFLTRINRTSLK